MPDFGRYTIDAIDRVIEDKKDSSEWDADEMRSALIDVRKGADQESAVADRSFSQATLSNRLQDVRDVEKEMRQEMEESPSLFRDPMDDAVQNFRGFFERLNENYDMGIKEVAIRMMVDEIKDAQQLPAPNYVHHFLKNANSGVANEQEISYITRRYDKWLDNFREEMSQKGTDLPIGGHGAGGGGGGTGIGSRGMGGPEIGSPDQWHGGQGGGGWNRGQPQHGQQGRGQHRQQGPPPQQRRDSGPSEEVEALKEQVEELREMVAEQQQDDDDVGTITITQEDGSQITVPADDPRAEKLFEEEDEGLLEQMTKLKEAGLIVTPEQLQNQGSEDAMASEISDAIESLGQQQLQVQQQMSQNFQEALDSLREMEEEDEDLSLSDVEELMEEKLTKSQIEQVREEMDERYSDLAERMEKASRRNRTGEQDPEFLKTDRKMEYQEKQLETLNENLRQIPEAVARSVREVVPAMKEIQFSQAGGSPFWNPPGEQARGQPGYVPGEVEEERPPPPQRAPSPEQAEQGEAHPGARGESAPAPEEQTEAQRAGYPDAEAEPESPSPEAEEELAQRAPSGVSEEDAQSVRSKLGLDDDNGNEEATA